MASYGLAIVVVIVVVDCLVAGKLLLLGFVLWASVLGNYELRYALTRIAGGVPYGNNCLLLVLL